jgi:hypothetical protein
MFSLGANLRWSLSVESGLPAGLIIFQICTLNSTLDAGIFTGCFTSTSGQGERP